jgi:hypothetical protein
MDWLAAYNGFLVRVGLYLMIFWPTVGYYVYRDTMKRNLSSPKVRGVAYGAFGILGLVIYVSQKARTEADSA